MRRSLVMLATMATTLFASSLVAVPTPASAAGAYQQVLHVYERSGDVPPCQFTGAQLQSALAGIDAYGAQYFADFTQAVQAALTARAAGACAAAAPSAPGTGTPRVALRSIPGPPAVAVTAATGSGVPFELVVLGALAVLALLGGLAVAVRRRLSP